jgi:hypothetical protein
MLLAVHCQQMIASVNSKVTRSLEDSDSPVVVSRSKRTAAVYTAVTVLLEAGEARTPGRCQPRQPCVCFVSNAVRVVCRALVSVQSPEVGKQ